MVYRIRPVGGKRPLGRFPFIGPFATPRAPNDHVQPQLLYARTCFATACVAHVLQGGALTTSDFRELSARLSSLAMEVPACRGRVLSVLEGIPTTAVLSTAILTMAMLTMAILTMAMLTMAILTMAHMTSMLTARKSPSARLSLPAITTWAQG